MYNLVSHPDALQVVRQQILDVLRLSGVEFSPDKDVTLSRDVLDKLVYLGKVPDQALAVSLSAVTDACGVCSQRAPSTKASVCHRPP